MDVDNCFHRLRIGQSLAEWFCVEPVRARDVSMNGREVSRQTVEDDEWIYPCAGALPMGFTWSLCFAQSTNENTLHEVEGIQDVSIMNDRTQPCVLDIKNPWRVFGKVYVGNLGLLGSPPHARESRQNEFGAVGLRTHEASLGEAVHTTLGHVLDCRQHVTKTSPRAGCFVGAESRDWSHCCKNVGLCTLSLCAIVTYSRSFRQVTSLFGRVIGAPRRCGARCVSNLPFPVT